MNKYICLIISMILICVLVCGCSQDESKLASLNEDNDASSPEAGSDKDAVIEEGKNENGDNALQMTDIQLNSICMLNYLAGITQEINATKNSRLYLEDVYSILLNNMNPNTVDEKTQDQLIFLMETLNNYRMISIKRDTILPFYGFLIANPVLDF